MTRIRTVVSGVALALTLACILWLARLEAAGPKIVDLELDGGVPASLYLPVSAAAEGSVAEGSVAEGSVAEGSAREGARLDDLGAPPVVVLAHGVASDRFGTSVLARALTQAGYAVLTLDFRGHGANRNPFSRRGGKRDALLADLRTAVDFLRTSRDVDGARISVMGHSMGAAAVLEYASLDPALDATVMISGGRRVDGPQRPSNALFIYAAADPERVRVRSARLAAELAGVARAAPGQLFGSFEESTAVSQVEVAKADHITILSSLYAARQIIDWLDRSYGVERGTFFLRADPRVRTALVGLLAFVFVLPGLGVLVGRLAPRFAERPGRGAAGRLAWLALALLATLPLVSVGDPQRVVPLAIGNTIVVHLFAAGVALLALLSLRDRFDGSMLRMHFAAGVCAAAFGFVAVVLLMTPFGVVLHGLGLTPERAGVAGFVMLLLAPFQLVFHDQLRRGGLFAATVASSLGRLVVIGVLVVAVQVGVLPGVVMLLLPALVVLFVLFEILSSAVYAASRNYTVPALVESAWLAWVLAAVLPITI